MEFELEIPTGWSVEEWVIPNTPIIGDMIISGFISLCVCVIPVAIIAEISGMDVQAAWGVIISSFTIGAGLTMASIEYLKQERIHDARVLKQAYSDASKPNVEADKPIRIEMLEDRNEAQANKYAYKFIGNLNVSRETFDEWAKEVVQPNSNLAFAHWTGKGKSFSRRSYELFLDHMAGINVAYKSEKGWVLTNGGKRSLKRYIASVGI